MTPQKTLSPRAWSELLLLAAIWGGSFLSNRIALDEVPVLTTVALRVLGAALLLWGYVALRGLALPRRRAVWGAFLVMGLLNNVIPFSLITWGQLSVPSGLAAIVNASTAIFGVLIASLAFRDEILTLRRFGGALIGVTGVALAIGPQVLDALDLTALPQLALVGAAISYACAAVWARKALAGLSPHVAAAGMLTGSSVVMVPAALLADGVPGLAYGAPAWAAIGYLSVIATAGAYLLYYRVLAMAGAGNLSLVTLLTAPVAILLGAVVLSEAIPLHAWVGFGLIAVGLLVIDGRLLARKEPA